MSISKVGGLIAAASMKATKPNLKLGKISVVQQIVLTLQQAGVFPIVVVTGVEADEVKYSLSGRGVVFLHNEDYQDPELFESVCMGLDFLKGVCDRVVFAPVNVPLFSQTTLRKLLVSSGDIVTPSFNQRGGHPIIIADQVIPKILSYKGDGGLRGAMSKMEDLRRRVEVTDEGILLNVHQPEALKQCLKNNKKKYIYAHVKISIEGEEELFNARAKLLLLLIGKTHSVRASGSMMAMSVSKAWNTLNKLEAALGYKIITRRKGGKYGSGSDLTEKGRAFLLAFQQYEEAMQGLGNDLFRKTFYKNGILKQIEENH